MELNFKSVFASLVCPCTAAWNVSVFMCICLFNSNNNNNNNIIIIIILLSVTAATPLAQSFPGAKGRCLAASKLISLWTDRHNEMIQHGGVSSIRFHPLNTVITLFDLGGHCFFRARCLRDEQPHKELYPDTWVVNECLTEGCVGWGLIRRN